jgi:hypothetical protein
MAEGAPVEKSRRMGQGQINGDVTTFIAFGGREIHLVVVGRSMENEMASISLPIDSW